MIKSIPFESVKEITLLTTEQTERLPLELLSCGEWWWLRSPGNYQYTAASVDIDGSVGCNGNLVYSDYDCVRPAFLISDLNSKIGAKVQVGNCACTVIDKDLVLADDVVCRHRFDAESNDWGKSELKAFMGSDEFVKILEGGKFNVD